jgi:signal transduction histidine kinase
MADAAGIAHEMTYDEDIDWDTMSAEMKINLYRIVQESLQNCVKHAQAGNISLNLHGNSKNIVITISDDGRGFSPQGGKKGIGHKNISSRIKKLNGVWEISSQPGKGTTVTIKVPYIETSPDRHAREQDSGKLQEA